MPPQNTNKKEESLQEKISGLITEKPTPKPVENFLKKNEIPKESVPSPAPTPPPVPQPAPLSIKAKIPPNGPLKSLRTYQGDIEEILGKTKSSVTSVVLDEKKRRDQEELKAMQSESPIFEDREEKKPQEVKAQPNSYVSTINSTLNSLPQQAPTNTFESNIKQVKFSFEKIRGKLFFYSGLVLLLAGVVVLATVYISRPKNSTYTFNGETTILSFSKAKDMNISSSTRKNFLSAVVNEKNNLKLPVNSILYLNTGDIGRFVTLLAPRMPAGLARSLDKKYMFGIYSYNTNEPFIILTENDYGLSYSGMLEWEKNMVSDLGEIFALSELGTSTPIFTDEALKNKDLRIIKGSKRKTLLLYSFLDKNTILITSNEEIFSAILGKYMTSKIMK